jgi:hypothetical protein
MRGVSDLDPAIWAPVPIAPMPMLAYLRVRILSRSAKWMPKWKLRVSPDIVAEVQPRPNSLAALFRCGSAQSGTAAAITPFVVNLAA